MTRLADLKQQFQALVNTLEYQQDYNELSVVHGDKRLIATWEKAIANIHQFINDQQEQGNTVTKQEYTPSTSVEQSDDCIPSEDEAIDVQTTAEPTAPYVVMPEIDTPVLDYSNDEPFDVAPTDEQSKPWKYRNNGIIPRRVLRRGNRFIRNLLGTTNGQQHTRDSKDRHNRIPFYTQPYDLRGAIKRQPMQVHFRHTEEGYGLHKVSAVM
jgi:hypothetical protein